MKRKFIITPILDMPYLTLQMILTKNPIQHEPSYEKCNDYRCDIYNDI